LGGAIDLLFSSSEGGSVRRGELRPKCGDWEGKRLVSAL